MPKKSEKVSNGNIASKLGALNAAHASAKALANASPNSRVGKIAAYRDANAASVTAAEDAATQRPLQRQRKPMLLQPPPPQLRRKPMLMQPPQPLPMPPLPPQLTRQILIWQTPLPRPQRCRDGPGQC